MFSIAHKRGLVNAFVAGVAVLGAAVAAGFGAKTVVKAPEVGDQAPAFTLTDTEGETYSLSDYEGKIVVLTTADSAGIV